MKLHFTGVAAALALSACATTTVPTETGVGFGDYYGSGAARSKRDLALEATAAHNSTISTDELARAGIASSASNEQYVNEREGVVASPLNAAPTLVGLSDEQDFEAVAERETIESDAERRAAQAAAREQIEPTALPDRPANTGPNIVEYALNAPNVKGQEWYSRFVLQSQARYLRNCSIYPTPDDAQRDFLARGGPERDRLGIDPDGDGFACGWDPAPFVMALQN